MKTANRPTVHKVIGDRKSIQIVLEKIAEPINPPANKEFSAGL